MQDEARMTKAGRMGQAEGERTFVCLLVILGAGIVIRASSLFSAYVRLLFHAANLATGGRRRYSPKTCVGLSETLGALKRRPFCWMGCVVLNIEATTQPVSLL